MNIDYNKSCLYENLPPYNFYNDCKPNIEWSDYCKKTYTCTNLESIVSLNPHDSNFQINDENLRNCIYNNFFKIKTTTPSDNYNPYNDVIQAKNICTNVDNTNTNVVVKNTFNFPVAISIIFIVTIISFFVFMTKK